MTRSIETSAPPRFQPEGRARLGLFKSVPSSKPGLLQKLPKSTTGWFVSGATLRLSINITPREVAGPPLTSDARSVRAPVGTATFSFRLANVEPAIVPFQPVLADRATK